MSRTFLPATTYAAGSQPKSITTADVNGDGKLDLVVADGSGGVSVLLGNGSGGFGAATLHAAGQQPASAITADVNGDGKLDLVVADSYFANVEVLLGDGHGGFGAATTYAAGNAPDGVAAADVNGDGKLDLVVSDLQGETQQTGAYDQLPQSFSVLLGNGSGGFAAPLNNDPYNATTGGPQHHGVAHDAGFYPRSVTTADVNRDGKADFVFASRYEVVVQLGDGSGGFQKVNIDNQELITDAIVADVNGDGILDLIVSAPKVSGAGIRNGDVQVLLGNGSGGFGAATSYAAGRSPVAVTAADVNGDGKLDLVVTDGYDNGGPGGYYGVSVLLGDGAGGFGPPTAYATSGPPISVTTADVNGDGKADILIAATFGANGQPGYAAVLLGSNVVGITGATATASRPGPLGIGQSVRFTLTPDEAVAVTGTPVLTLNDGATAVFNAGASTPTALVFDYTIARGQGSADLQAVSLTLNGATVLVGPLTIAAAATYAAGPSPQSVTVADLNRDGRPDLVIADGAGGLSVLLGNGSGGFGAATTYLANLHFQSVAVADVNGDGQPDLVVESSAGPAVLLGNGSGGFAAPVFYAGGAGASVTTADMNGDGQLDLIAASAGGVVFVSLRSGNGTATTTYADGAPTPVAATTADVNGDGKADIVVADASGNLSVLLGNGSGGFVAALNYAAGPAPASVVAADVNGDGKIDLVVADSGGGVAVLLGNGSGGFSAPTTYAAGPAPQSVAVADVNRDGKPDLVVADKTGGVSVLLNNGSGGFGPAITYAAGPTPVAVAVADLNRDGAADLVVADQTGGVAVLLNKTSVSGTFDPASAAAAPGLNTGLVIDGIAPTFTVTAQHTPGAGQPFVFTLTPSEPVNVNGAPFLSLNDGGTAVFEPYLSNSTSLVFYYYAAAGENAFALAINRVVLPTGASITDAAGNAASLLGADVTFNGLSVNTLPAVSITSITATPSGPGPLIAGQGVRFTLATPRAVTVAGSPVLTLSDGGTATFNAAASSATALVFDYTVGVGQSSADLLVSSLTLNGATIGVPATLGLAAPATYAAGPAPHSVTAADVNGDGRADLIVADDGGGVAVLLGNGSGGFGAPVTYAAGPTPYSATTADVNGDGTLDIIAADKGGGVSVLLGNGSGGFGAATTYAAGPSSRSVATADVNGDGRADLLVADYDGRVSVLLGTVGGFAAATTFAAGPTPYAVATGDMNADGKPDLVVADYGGGVSVLLGDGSGGFGAAVTYAAGLKPDFVTVADVNGDGRPDLIVADGGGGLSVLLGNGSGGFGMAVSYAARPVFVSVTVAEMNGDGKLDLVAADSSGGVSVLLGDGSGGFGTPTSYAAGHNPISVTTADVNGDGKPDVVVAGGSGIVVALNTSLATAMFDPAGAASAPGHDTGIVIDAAPTFTAAATPSAGSVTVGQVVTITLTASKPVTVTGTPTLTLNDGGTATYDAAASTATSLVFTTTVTAGQNTSALAVTSANLPAGASIVDAAGNAALLAGAAVTFSGLAVITPVIVSSITATPSRTGPLDAGQGVTFTLALTRGVSVTGSPVLTLSNNATATFDAAASSATALVFDYAVAAGQDSADLAVSSLTLNGATVAVPGVFAIGAATTYAAGPAPSAVATADLNGDGKLDMVVADSAGGVAVLLGNGSGGFGAAATFAAGLNPYSVTTADVNADGKLDLVVADQGGSMGAGGGVAVLLGDGAGGFGAAATFAAGPTPYSVVTLDVSGDGKPDIVAADYNGGVSVLLGNGSGGFGAPVTYAAGLNPYSVTAADVNGDGKTDLVVAARNGGVSVLLGNGAGGFAAATTYAAGVRPRFAAAADLNGDGRPDLVVANMGPGGGAGGGGVSVLLANGSGGFGPATSYAAGPNPRTLVIADLNGDGRPDIAVADQGGGVAVLLGDGSGGFGPAMTYAVGPHATSVAVADINGDGRPDLLVSDQSGAGVGVLLNNSAAPGTFDPASAATAPGHDTGLAIDTTAPTVTQSNTHGSVLSGTAEAGGTVTVSNGASVLGTAPVGTDGLWQFTPGLSYGSYTLTASEPDPAGNIGSTSFAFTEDGTPCYCRGTLILTDRGEVAVEDLAIGDCLVTQAGPARPIRWIGTRAYAGRLVARNRDRMPVLFRQGSLADGVPRRDLMVSPLHAMFLDGLLVPARALVNGGGVVQVATAERVEYFHLELDSHDVIWAEGAASETFVDDGSRGMFHNAAAYGALYPDAVQAGALYCAPRVEQGEALEAIRLRLAARWRREAPPARPATALP